MLTFNVGAQRPATDDVRSERITAANKLVQRTLAQYGLGSVYVQSGSTTQAMPAFRHLLCEPELPFARTSPHRVAVPDGAEFRQDQFTCAAGSRSFRTYVPSTAQTGATGIVVMLHGCTQNPEDFAAGTGMNALAEKHRFVVIYPQQSRGDNAQSCWNWFSRADQRRDRGEPAILAGMTRAVMAEHDIPRDQTFVAGLSAGAAMAVILGETYPDVFAGVGAHSGLAYGTAKDVPSAFAAMAGNAPNVADSAPTKPAVRTMVFHGTADATVHPSNGDRIARDVMDRGARQAIETDERGNTSGRSYTRKTSAGSNGAAELEHWVVEGMGHAWSGGQSSGSYTDAKGPDASAEMIRFFFDTKDTEA